MNNVYVTNQKELDEFLNNTTNDKDYYCVKIRAVEPLVVKTSEVNEFKLFGDSVVRFLEVTDETCIFAYDNAVATIESKMYSRVFGYNNSIIFNFNKYESLVCDLFDNAKFVDKCLNQDVACEMFLTVNDITTQEKLDECFNLYGNYENATFCINQSYSEHGSELVVNKKTNIEFDLKGVSKVVFKKPTNTDNESIDYCINAYGKSTAILETNNCKIIACDESTIIKRCKGEFAYKYFSKNAKLIDESHLLDANVHKETSKGWGK
jgi:hypothetical protein